MFKVKCDWDPLKDAETTHLTATASSRITRDLLNLYTEPPPGIFAVGEESNKTFIHAIIIGPMETPYEGGFFYFVMKCPSHYPILPPKVRLMTTNAGSIRFNPNMYNNGKICLSILGTWNGPEWSPAQQLSGLLISIQSLLSEKPYYNEPGFIMERVPGDVERYNDFVRYHTLRVAVIGMVKNECSLNIPQQLQEIIEKSFLQYFDQYMETANQNLHLDGTMLVDPLSFGKYPCSYKTVVEDLKTLHTKYSNKHTPLLQAPSEHDDECAESEEFVTNLGASTENDSTSSTSSASFTENGYLLDMLNSYAEGDNDDYLMQLSDVNDEK